MTIFCQFVFAAVTRYIKKRKQKERVETLVETQSAEDYLFLYDGGKYSCF